MPQAADMAFEVRLRAAAVPLIGSGIWGFGFRVSGAAVSGSSWRVQGSNPSFAIFQESK